MASSLLHLRPSPSSAAAPPSPPSPPPPPFLSLAISQSCPAPSSADSSSSRPPPTNSSLLSPVLWSLTRTHYAPLSSGTRPQTEGGAWDFRVDGSLD
ncbi:hypothetical protein LINPERPRIM_LOCUS18159 [Linum perenne]